MKSYESDNNSAKNDIYFGYSEERDRGYAPDTAVSTHFVRGVLEIMLEGFGFLRQPEGGLARAPGDPYVSAALINKLRLRNGNEIVGRAKHVPGAQGPRVIHVDSIDGLTVDESFKVIPFERLTPVMPRVRFQLETSRDVLSTRIMDLFTPMGRGQRTLIVAPPRSGKTVLLQQICNAITENNAAEGAHKPAKVVVLLVDERPEEATDFRRTVNAQVFASTLDRTPADHVRLAELVVDRCKRMVEAGEDVVLLIDSITRLARAYNKLVDNGGRTMSGGVDISALDVPKRLFSTARATEEAGTLTVVATALIDTGSRMDEVIFQEFKGTGNMEIVLSRELADKRIWPAIDLAQSGTRREEALMQGDDIGMIYTIRRSIAKLRIDEKIERLRDALAKYPTNKSFLDKCQALF